MFKSFFTGLYLSTLLLLSAHVHSEHSRDIHKSHGPCCVCANSAQFRQKAAFAETCLDINPKTRRGPGPVVRLPRPAERQASNFSARAPPF